MTNTKTALIIIALLAVSGLAIMLLILQTQPVETQSPTETTTTSDSTSAPQGKIDINAVCDGALAYMTFTDGDAAAKFVSECKEGKHPEVIDRYRADMSLGDGAAI